jgi:ABC-type transport system substrate-binding protein
MDLLPLELGVLRSRMKGREFEAAVCAQRVVGISPESFFGEQARPWLLQQNPEPSPIGYRNPQLTKLLARLRTTADPDARDQAHREMSDLLRRDQPIAFLFKYFGASGADVVHRRVKGLSSPWRADPFQFTEDLWLEDQSER